MSAERLAPVVGVRRALYNPAGRDKVELCVRVHETADGPRTGDAVGPSSSCPTPIPSNPYPYGSSKMKSTSSV